MSTCKYEESVEDLVLTSPGVFAGSVMAGHDAQLEAHLETCERCSAALEMLMEERALFVKRAPFVPPPPIALPTVTRSVMPLVTPLFPSVFAAVACAAALFGLFVRPPTMEAPLVRAESYDEPLACAFPASGITSPGEVLATVVPDRATCEERVTSSLATP